MFLIFNFNSLEELEGEVVILWDSYQILSEAL